MRFWTLECLLTYLSMVTVPHIMVRLERMLDYRGVGLERFYCNNIAHNNNRVPECGQIMNFVRL